MISRPQVSVDHLHLELVRTSGKGLGQEIELHLMDSGGTAIMTFKLPEDIARALTTGDEEELQITMSPNGLLEVYSCEQLPRRLVSMEFYELIEQSLLPDMLDDEIELRAKLSALRIKLVKALALVEQTVSSLSE